MGAGSTVLTVSQLTDANYFAGSVTYTLVIAKGITNLSISVSEVSAKKFGDTAFQLGVTTNSTGSKIYESSNSSVGTISSTGLVTIMGAGSTVLTVSQLTDANYLAGSVTYTLEVAKGVSNLSMVGISRKTNGDAPFEVVVTTSSTGVKTYESSNILVATVSNVGLVTIVGAGTTTIKVSELETVNNLGGMVSQDLIVDESSASNPTVITGGSGLSHYLTTSAPYAILSSDILLPGGKLVSSGGKKVIKSSKRLTIKKG
jgi:hypothetical protein